MQAADFENDALFLLADLIEEVMLVCIVLSHKVRCYVQSKIYMKYGYLHIDLSVI